MSFLVPLAMFGWIPFGLLLFAMLDARRAILTAYIIGWLFLPQAGYVIPGLPDYSRMVAVNFVVFAGLAAFDGSRLLSWRPCLWDIPIVVWCLSSLPTSLLNGLGPYDGFAGIMSGFLEWGLPYWVGRVYFSDWSSIRMLAVAVFIGGLIYIPLCLVEIRLSPQIHRWVYGYHRAWGGMRLGGYRPSVFLNTGLELGVWMTTTALVGVWLWRSGTVKTLLRLPVGPLAVVLLITTVLCRSLGALMLLAVGWGTLIATKRLRSRVVLLGLLLGPAVYVCVRATQIFYPEQLVAFVSWIDEDRAGSFEARLLQEDVLGVKAWERPFFGWGGWGRNRVYDDRGESEVVTDSLWIIVFGSRGFVGLVSLGLVFLLPGLLLLRSMPKEGWWSPMMAPAGVLAVCIALYAGDRLMNAMPNPIFHVMMGAVLGVALRARRSAIVPQGVHSPLHRPEVRAAPPVVRPARARGWPAADTRG